MNIGKNAREMLARLKSEHAMKSKHTALNLFIPNHHLKRIRYFIKISYEHHVHLAVIHIRGMLLSK